MRLKNLNNNNNITIRARYAAVTYNGIIVFFALMYFIDYIIVYYMWDEKSRQYKYGRQTAVIDLVTRSAAEVRPIQYSRHIPEKRSCRFQYLFLWTHFQSICLTIFYYIIILREN